MGQRLFFLMIMLVGKILEHQSVISSIVPANYQSPIVNQIRELFSYGSWFLIICLGSKPAIAQDLEPINPDRPRPVQPQPLPPTENPLDRPQPLPLPDSVIDIPGTIVIEQFDFVGSSVFSSAELNQAVAQFTNKPISFAQLVQAANVITELYISKGYITSGAYLPEQSLDPKMVQIQIVEGSLAEIEVNIVKGGLNKDYIRDRLQAKTGNPLNINQLQSALQLLQLNPIIESLNAELAAGIEPGTNLLSVSVVTADTFSLEINLNNNRNISIGTFERGVQLEEANLLGIGDRFRFTYDNTDGSNQFGGGYTIPINASDGSIGFNFRLATSEIVQASFEELDIDIESRNFDLSWRQPVLQKANPDVTQELAFSLSAARRESEGTIMDEPEPLTPGADDDGEIRTSVLSFGQEWLQRNPRQVFALRSQFNFGVDAFSTTVLDEEPDSQFFSWRGQFSYLRLLSTPEANEIGSTILLRSEVQLSADPLVSTEQFSLGGAPTVRGYRQDAILTDNGFLAAVELRLPFIRLSKIDTTVQFTPFVDFGTGWNADGEEPEFSTLIGTGFGLLIQKPDRFSARIEWGIPLINDEDLGSSLQEDGVYFQLQYDLF